MDMPPPANPDAADDEPVFEVGTVMQLMAESGTPQEHKLDRDHLRAFRMLLEECRKAAHQLDRLQVHRVIDDDQKRMLREKITKTIQSKFGV